MTSASKFGIYLNASEKKVVRITSPLLVSRGAGLGRTSPTR